MNTIQVKLRRELDSINNEGLFKQEHIIQSQQDAEIIVNKTKVLNFCANNYLGLANHPKLIQTAKNSVEEWGFGLSSVRFICGTQTIHNTLEKKLSQAAIETLAIIVYHQPVTRAEIEEIRGVAFGTNTLEILMELNWVKPQGRKNVPGKPIQYGTTDDFLSHFGLQKLSDLPTVDELGSAGMIDSVNIDSSIFGTGKFYKEKQDSKKVNIYSNIDEMLSSTLKSEDQE